uniref:Uncharacterized protein n=1 Tax=Anguilla anguilla TaxID=7936 RepID=A0A0E9SVI4_ANGAN
MHFHLVFGFNSPCYINLTLHYSIIIFFFFV